MITIETGGRWPDEVRRILEHIERELADDGVRMLHVKTYGPSGASAEYERTREFYEGTGFIALEERTDIWGPGNPCLVLAKPIGSWQA